MIVFLAEHGFSIALSPESKDAIRFLLESMFWIDQYVDNLNGSKKKQAIKDIFMYLDNKEVLDPRDVNVCNSLSRLRVILDDLSEEKRSEFLKNVLKVFENGNRLASAKSIHEFAKWRNEEAIASANMVLNLTRELGKDQRFVRFMHQITITGNLLDSIEDAREDISSGKIAIKPGLLYFGITCHMLGHAVKAMSAYPNKRQAIWIGTVWMLRHLGLKSHVPWHKMEEASFNQKRQTQTDTFTY